MPRLYIHQYPAEGRTGKRYMISVTFDGDWECSCAGWIKTYPRQDCRHILAKKLELANGRIRDGLPDFDLNLRPSQNLPKRRMKVK